MPCNRTEAYRLLLEKTLESILEGGYRRELIDLAKEDIKTFNNCNTQLLNLLSIDCIFVSFIVSSAAGSYFVAAEYSPTVLLLIVLY